MRNSYQPLLQQQFYQVLNIIRAFILRQKDCFVRIHLCHLRTVSFQVYSKALQGLHDLYVVSIYLHNYLPGDCDNMKLYVINFIVFICPKYLQHIYIYIYIYINYIQSIIYIYDILYILTKYFLSKIIIFMYTLYIINAYICYIDNIYHIYYIQGNIR